MTAAARVLLRQPSPPPRAGIASSIVTIAGKGTASSILAVERRRAKLGVTHAELCRRARIGLAAWWELRRGARRPAHVTVARLERALDELAAGEMRAPSPPAIAMLFRSVMALVAREQALDAGALLEQALDFASEKPRNPEWLAMARARRLAIYVITVELEIPNADLARAIGCSRQNIKQARDRVEDWRDDPGVNALLGSVARTMGK